MYWISSKAGESRGRAPGQASDYALLAPNPLGSSPLPDVLSRFWAPNQSGPQVFYPTAPPPSRRPCAHHNSVYLAVIQPQLVEQQSMAHM